MKTFIIALALASLTGCGSGNGFLVSEKVEKKQGLGQKTLTCVYMTPRGTRTSEWWYAPNNFMGRASCPSFR